MTRELYIAGRRIAEDERPYVIAEIGHNHQGDLARAKQLFFAAAEAGCDAVKLQKRDMAWWAEHDPEWNDPYVSENSFGATRGAHRAYLELGAEAYAELARLARVLGMAFIATAFDPPSLEFLADVGVDAVKLASGSIANRELLEGARAIGRGPHAVGSGDVPLLLSTGGATMGEVMHAHYLVQFHPHAILQCTSLYPCPEKRLNLLVIRNYREYFPQQVIGLSDHQDGIDQAPTAVALGARIFEKHFTFSHSAKGSDHAMSLEPEGMRRYVRGIRRAHEALGDGYKTRLDEEIPAVVKQGRWDLR